MAKEEKAEKVKKPKRFPHGKWFVGFNQDVYNVENFGLDVQFLCDGIAQAQALSRVIGYITDKGTKGEPGAVAEVKEILRMKSRWGIPAGALGNESTDAPVTSVVMFNIFGDQVDSGKPA